MMEKDRFKNLCLLLDNDKKDREIGQELAKEISYLYNCCGDYRKISSQLYERLSLEGKKCFLICLCLAAMEMAHTWNISGRAYWDDRKVASMSFSHDNLTYFKELFFKQTGFLLTVEAQRSNYFLHCIAYREIKDTFMEGFLCKWGNMHPTIQQSFFGGVVRGVLMQNTNLLFASSLDCRDAYFPFI